jgi:hypothetical protein
MTELAEAIASLVGPYLPVLIARGEVLLEEAETVIAPELRKRAETVWNRLHPSMSESPGAESAVRLAAERPGDVRARAALELQIEDILRGDSTLADEMRELLALDAEGEQVPLAEVVTAARAAATDAGLDERALRVLDGDLAIVLDEATSEQPNRAILDSRLRSLTVLSKAVEDPDAARRFESAVDRIASALRQI